MFRIAGQSAKNSWKSKQWIRFSVRCLRTSTKVTPPQAPPPSQLLRTQSDPYQYIQTKAQPVLEPPNKMPPDHKAKIGKLKTFTLPHKIETISEHIAMGKAMINAWQETSIFQILMTKPLQESFEQCINASRSYFRRPFAEKSKHVDDQSFSGYIASGEELTGGIADYSEIFTVTKDVPLTDPRVKARWPSHGPCPWPDENYKYQMTHFMSLLGDSGEKLLQLTALGLGLGDINFFKGMTRDGWHHMRNLRFPALNNTNGTTKRGRGIGSHTDYGLFVIAAPDLTGGDFVRPRRKGESIEEWQRSAAGASEDEDDDKWLFVPPVPNTMTCFPGDMMQLLTNNILPATPHKVGLNTTERFAFAYFHEPNFNTVIEVLPELKGKSPDPAVDEKVHYGSHFTEQFLSNYPKRITAKRIQEEGRLGILEEVKKEALEKGSWV